MDILLLLSEMVVKKQSNIYTESGLNLTLISPELKNQGFYASSYKPGHYLII